MDNYKQLEKTLNHIIKKMNDSRSIFCENSRTDFIRDYLLVIAPVVADLCTTPVALSAPPNSYRIIANHDSHDWLNNSLILF